MKILIVSSWYPPILSGSSLWAESLVGALRKRHHDVRVVTTEWAGAPRETQEGRAEIVYRLPARLAPRNRFLLGLSIVPLAWSPANRRRMLQIVREFQPDVIHQVNHIFDTVALSAYAARQTGTPLVGSITTPIQSKSPLIHTLMRWADLATVYHFGVRHWHRIICSDSTQARYVLDSYGKRVNGRVVTDIFVGVHEKIRRGVAQQRAPFPQIITVGHVHPSRDPTNLVRAMPAILERCPDAKLCIAGRIQFERPVLEARRLGLESAVSFLGEVSQEGVVELVSKAHVFAILHQCPYAGLSFTAIEAMQFETPVVINAPSDLYGPGTVIDGETLVLVNASDFQEIARKILRLLQDRPLRERIGRNGKEFVDSYLDWNRTAQKTEKLYQDTVATVKAR
jgi:glycosyltransferase involved in cell wall biosynthesis